MGHDINQTMAKMMQSNDKLVTAITSQMEGSQLQKIEAAETKKRRMMEDEESEIDHATKRRRILALDAYIDDLYSKLLA